MNNFALFEFEPLLDSASLTVPTVTLLVSKLSKSTSQVGGLQRKFYLCHSGRIFSVIIGSIWRQRFIR